MSTPPYRPSARLRVIIVNDSSTLRASLRVALSSEVDIDIVAELDDGDAVLDAVERLRPSVVLMDVVMPKLDGYAAARLVMAKRPTPIVLVSAAVDPRDTRVVLAALDSGALAITESLPSPIDPTYPLRRGTLVQLLRSMARVRVSGVMAAPPLVAPRAATSVPLPTRAKATALSAIGIVSSAGGPQALLTLLKSLPHGALPPILIVQHIARGFADGLVTWLAESSGYATSLAIHGALLRHGVAYVAPDGLHLGASADGSIVLSDDPADGAFRPSGTHLLRSLAHAFGARAAGVVLSGMGDDGAAGAVALAAKGGSIAVQDESSSLVFAMPRATAELVPTATVLPVTRLGGWICQRSGV